MSEEIKDSIECQGIDESFIWYEAVLIYKQLKELNDLLGYRFSKMVRTVQDRHEEELKLMIHLKNENEMLKDLLVKAGMRRATREEKIANPGVYWVPDTKKESK